MIGMSRHRKAFMKKKCNFFFMIILAVILISMNIESVAKSKTMYARTNVNIRTGPTQNSKKVGMLYSLNSIKAVNTSKGWTKVVYKNKIRYIKRKFLTIYKPKYVTKSVPKNSFKSYEPYQILKYKQGGLQRRAHTDKNGLRKVGNRYCIALGSYYSTRIGCKVDLVMSDGRVVKCILADVKANKHTNSRNQKHLSDGSLVEFVVDIKRLPRKVKLYGDISKIKKFKRNVQRIRIYK